MPLGQLGGDELQDVGRNFEVAQVDRGNAVLLGEEVGQLLLVEDAELGEAVAQPRAGFSLFFLGLL